MEELIETVDSFCKRQNEKRKKEVDQEADKNFEFSNEARWRNRTLSKLKPFCLKEENRQKQTQVSKA